MVVSEISTQPPVQGVHNIMGGIENTGDVRLHNHRRKLKQRFDIVKKLGQGTYGKVQLGINKETGQEVAIKTIRKSKIETEADLVRIRREIQIMSSVRHPNIIHIYEVFENREKMVLVMEYAAGGELYDYLSERKVLGEDEARRIFRQIATAVYYCHKHNICHRDLKLENILLDEIGNAKIADFGLSNVFTFNALLSTFCGSPLYASPEIVKGTPYHGPEVDCWSLGVLLYTLVYGAMPFDGSNFKRLVKQISQGNYFEPKNSSPASSLIGDMLNVNPARRADITAICSHRWMNESYKEMCLDLAEELASQTPVRLDLLLSLTAPAVNSTNIVVDNDLVAGADGMNGMTGRPVRSQSLGSIPPPPPPPTSTTTMSVAVPSLPIPEAKETKEIAEEEKKSKTKKLKERSHSRTRRKERSRSRSRKSDNKESHDYDANLNDSVEAVAKSGAPLVNSGTRVLSKAPSEGSKEPPLVPVDDAAADVPNESRKDASIEEGKVEPVESQRSKVFDVTEKFAATNEKPASKVNSQSKVVLPGLTLDHVRQGFGKSTISVTPESVSPPKKQSASPTDEEPFPLASTVALNKLVESAFRDSPFDTKASSSERESADKVAPKLLHSASAEGNSNKAATLPRRRTSRAEIQLIAPQLPLDNYKTEVEHFINKPAVNHKTEIVFPVNAPEPHKVLTKQNNQSKEHVIPIQIEQGVPRKIASPSSSWTTSKSSIPRTSSSSLSRQSTVESDSSIGEPIRKSPREVIIPIAVEGGGFVTPSEDTLTRMNSLNDSEDESRNGSRCFTLRSTKRRQPEESQTAQLEPADSLSSDEDDNFQLLTAENLFSTLLSRVRSLTQRLNNDEMRRSSAFPRSLFAQHGSLFDSLPRSRITETRSFNRPESAPWRRTLSQGQVPPQRDDLIKKRYSSILEERASLPPIVTLLSPEERGKLMTKSSGANVTKLDASGGAETTSSSIKEPVLPSKANVEDEFDRFFQRYKNPADTFSLSYSRTSPCSGSRSMTNFRRSSKEPEDVETIKSIDTDEKLAAAAAVANRPPRKSRFLRPDFYDTPREESKYVIQNDKVRAFRERSLSRQRDLSRNRSANALTTNGWSSDYLRSKTCSIVDKMDAGLQRRNNFARRTTSEDRTSNESNSSSKTTAGSRFELTSRLNSRNNDPELLVDSSFEKAKRKSLILQNELENEVRKTQNMYSKLSGLMCTLNDNEHQYEKKLEKLYGLKGDKSPKFTNSSDEGDKQTELAPLLAELFDTKDVLKTSHQSSPAACIESKKEHAQVVSEPPPTSSKLTVTGNCSKNYENLSLLDKKTAYFRKLRNKERAGGENTLLSASCTNESAATASTATSSSISSPEKDNMCSSIAPCEELDSDACSMLSDGTDYDNMKDRIRRRSFYTRFNSYNTTPRPTAVARTSSLSYSRSMSADVSTPSHHRLDSSPPRSSRRTIAEDTAPLKNYLTTK